MLEKIFPGISKYYLPRASSKTETINLDDTLSVRFPKEITDKIRKLSDIEGRDRSVIVRVLVLHSLEQIDI